MRANSVAAPLCLSLSFSLSLSLSYLVHLKAYGVLGSQCQVHLIYPCPRRNRLYATLLYTAHSIAESQTLAHTLTNSLALLRTHVARTPTLTCHTGYELPNCIHAPSPLAIRSRSDGRRRSGPRRWQPHGRRPAGAGSPGHAAVVGCREDRGEHHWRALRGLLQGGLHSTRARGPQGHAPAVPQNGPARLVLVQCCPHSRWLWQ